MSDWGIFGCSEIDKWAVFLGVDETPFCDYKIFNYFLPGHRQIEISVKIHGTDKKLSTKTEVFSLEAMMAE